MPREAQDVTEAEMGIMQALWSGGPGSIRQLATAIYGERVETAQYATVQKQLERLEAKGFVRRDRSLFVHLFHPVVGRDQLIGRRLQELADKLCGGSLAPILSHLAQKPSLTADERKALRELIDSPQSSARGKRKKQG
jgi:predicted transcriptional regulator